MTDQLSNKQLTVETAAVIICTYKRPDDLARCLAALTKQTRQPDEVIIVVRETDALTLNFVNARGTHRLPLRVATVAEPGLVAARVSGLSICSTDLVSFIDDDTIPYPDWLQRVFEHFRHDPQLGGLCGRDRCGDGIRFDDRTKEEVGKLRWH